MPSHTPFGPDTLTNGTYSSMPPGEQDHGGHGSIGGRPIGELPPGFDAHAGVPDELAALFLGEVRPAPPVASSQAEAKPMREGHRPRLTLLVLGNLPVFAGAWASQYVRSRARTSGRPLGLLSLTDEAARLEVYGLAGPGSMLASELARALAHLADAGADLYVRLPECETGWIAGECGAGTLAILTGADDPAIVAAYQSLKAITQDLPVGHAAGGLPAVRVTIAGCGEPRASESAMKLTQAAERFLGLRVGVEPAIAQIDAGASMELYHGPAPAWADVPDLLADYLGKAQAGPSMEPLAPAPRAREPMPEPVAVAWNKADRLEPRPVASAEASGPDRARVADAAAPAARPMPGGVEPLDVACPYARGVGLGVDDGGVPHIIAWATDSESASPAVRDLVVASSWLRDHAELVACLVGRPLRADTSVRHLVLSDGRGALGLAQGELRVHVGVGGGVVVDLN